MAAWIRNLVLLVFMACWSAYIITSLVRGEQLGVEDIGAPGVVYLALNPTWRKADDKSSRKDRKR